MDRSKREMFLFRSDLNKAKKKRRELHSLRCDLAYKLHVGYWVLGLGYINLTLVVAIACTAETTPCNTFG